MEQSPHADDRVRPLLLFNVAFALFRPSGQLEFASPSAVQACGDPSGRACADPRGTWHRLGEFARRAVGAGHGATLAGVVDAEQGRCRATVHLPDPEQGHVLLLVVLHPHLVDAPSELARFDLTPRESEVARLLATGLAIKQVAGRLGVSYHTARHHAERIYSKLGVHGRVEVARLVLGAA